MFGATTTVVGLVLLGIASACIILAIAAIRCYRFVCNFLRLSTLSYYHVAQNKIN